MLVTGRGRIRADVMFGGSSDNGGAKCWGRWVMARLAGGIGRACGQAASPCVCVYMGCTTGQEKGETEEKKVALVVRCLAGWSRRSNDQRS